MVACRTSRLQNIVKAKFAENSPESTNLFYLQLLQTFETNGEKVGKMSLAFSETT